VAERNEHHIQCRGEPGGRSKRLGTWFRGWKFVDSPKLLLVAINARGFATPQRAWTCAGSGTNVLWRNPE
jgi:hypothetical protein